MKLVFSGFELPLEIRRDKVNVLRVEDKSLYARVALSLYRGLPDDALEPALFFDDAGKELKTSKVLYCAGDALALDLNDKRIVSQAIKVILGRLSGHPEHVARIEELNYRIEDVFDGELIQLIGDYCFVDEWDSSKYLKMMGLGIDDSSDTTVFSRLCHFIRLMADLFPDQVVSLFNLRTYLTVQQYDEFCKQVASLQLAVLSCEQGCGCMFGNLENGMFIDIDYLER